MGKNKEGITVLSLFDGMSAAQLALQRIGIKVKRYFSCEINKYSIKVAQHNFPDTIQLGDVKNVFAKDLPKIDLLIGGSPCQGFSFAGKQLAFDDPRSKLFFEFVRLKNECNPTYFLLENVKMKKEFRAIISRFMGIAPKEFNSALVSGQNRKRLYWTNIASKPYGLFGDMQCTIPAPKDRGILLGDILEDEVPEKYYLSDKMLNYFANHTKAFNRGRVNIRRRDEKASCLTASMAKVEISDNFIKVDTKLRVTANQDKANCLTAGGKSGGLHSDMTLIAASRGRNTDKKGAYSQVLEIGYSNKSNALTSVATDNLVLRIPEATTKGYAEVKPGECFDFENPTSKTRRGRKMKDKSHTLTAKKTEFVQFTKEYRIRRLTPVECERLQTVPDGFTSVVSDTQRYIMLGNGFTVDMIAYILSFMDKAKINNQ